ncbi:hypothetical protein DFH06DRAFT_1123716 [Mycena polygramma]|nr:hypothetical protein DFH06DRAFT_1123716 [Mycena polygramma]
MSVPPQLPPEDAPHPLWLTDKIYGWTFRTSQLVLMGARGVVLGSPAVLSIDSGIYNSQTLADASAEARLASLCLIFYYYSPNSACNFAQGQASKVSEPNGGCIRPTQPDDLSELDINRSTMASKGQDRTRIFQVVMADTSATILRVSRVISFQPFISASGRRNEAPYPDAFKAASAQGMKWHGGHPAAVFSIDGSSRTYQFGSGHATHTHTAP